MPINGLVVPAEREAGNFIQSNSLRRPLTFLTLKFLLPAVHRDGVP